MKRITLKESFTLVLPLLILCAFIVPYDWFNHAYVVKRFGCGCIPGFNGNSFTLLFWRIMALCVTVIGAFTSRKVLGKRWSRVAYIVCILLLAMILGNVIYQHMMWL